MFCGPVLYYYKIKRNNPGDAENAISKAKVNIGYKQIL